MSFVKHKDFLMLKPWLYTQLYGRDDRAGGKGSRRRVEIVSGAPKDIRKLALNLKTPCPACGEKMRPFRVRGTAQRGGDLPENIYFAATCPERPSERAVARWRKLADDPTASASALRKALYEAANANKSCCKGGAASQEKEAVIAAVEK
jgi:hypothetical protein